VKPFRFRALYYLIVISLLAPVLGCSLAEAQAYSVAGAQALERQNNWNALVAYAQGWTKAEPNEMNAWASLSVAYYFLVRPDLALEPAKRGIALNPREPGGWTALGWVYRDLKRYPEATDAFKHAVDLAPRNGNHWNNLAAAYADQGDYLMTLRTLEQQQRSAGPYQNDVLWYNLGNGYLTVAGSMARGKPSGRPIEAVQQEAINAFKQCLAKNPRYADAWNNLGVAEESTGATHEALNDYRRAGALGNANGPRNYAALQREIAEAKAAAAAARSNPHPMRNPLAVALNERNYENWARGGPKFQTPSSCQTCN
jgi:tetratricopeptide (TPR) repeat protein